MSAMDIGATVTITVGDRDYVIERTGKATYATGYGSYRSYKLAEAAVREYDAQSYPRVVTAQTVDNLSYMAHNAVSPQARKFWTLRLNSVTTVKP
jgi:hypothetical protein